jgi:dipeptidase D
LGADNGIGVAYCLAAMVDPTLTCGSLEVLLTVDEEEGASGALGLRPGFISGHYLLNLDSEETGIITIGTAGFEITDYTLSLRLKKVSGLSAVLVAIRGLAGGHSGMDIHLPRLNSIKLATDALNTLRGQLPVRLSRFKGGEATNSIPSKAEFLALVPADAENRTLALLEEWREEIQSQAQVNEPSLEISIERDSATKAYSVEEADTICGLLTEIPHGPLAFSNDIEGLVESSNNLARIQSKASVFTINVSSRSSVESALEELSKKLKRIGENHGAVVKQHSRLPAWTAKPSSPFSKLVQKHYSSALGREVTLKAYHAGLECGIFTGLEPDIQMASIGPDIQAVHTPEESVDIPSVALLWDVLRRIVAGMGELAKTGENHEPANC